MFTSVQNDFDSALGLAKLYACKLHSLEILITTEISLFLYNLVESFSFARITIHNRDFK